MPFVPPARARRSSAPLLSLAVAAAAAVQLSWACTIAGAQAADAATSDPYVAYPCPIQGQDSAVVLGSDHDLQSACLALSNPNQPGPWTIADQERVDGSSQFCPRPVLTVLDQTGAMTIRFLPAEKGSLLADPAACCRAAEISSDPGTGRVKIVSIPGPDCLDGTPSPARTDLYRWNGVELTFQESVRDGAGSVQ